ncbi:MAG: tetratricopeptide repeat protein [Acidobacteria bacterium]|nr:tetratricopeptide repeat protein [Acidobacteriota bacterium]
MKRCPQCARDYNDDSLSFCLDDGSELLFGPASGRSEPGTIATGFLSGDEPATAIQSEPPALAGGQFTGESKTAILSEPPAIAGGLIGMTDESQLNTAILQPPATAGGSDSKERQSLSPNRAAEPRGKVGSRRMQLAVAVIAVLILVGGFFGFRYFTSSNSGSINSIAVLPFENRSGNADTEYLSDGLAESLIYRLSQLPDLKVSPTSSVFRYKGKEADPQVVAKELGVDSVMTGRITGRGDEFTISVNLVDTRNGKSLWGEQYERKQSELLTTQREIATEIANKLQLKLSGEERGLTKQYTTSNEAYQLYMKGRYQWNQRTGNSLKQAADFFNQAVEKDPDFALAYSGLAESYTLFGVYSVAAPLDAMPKAKAAALRAIELDDSLAETHVALGIYYSNFAWNQPAAEKEFRRAIELNPNYATAHQQFGVECLTAMSRFDEAVTEGKRAEELDPLSPIIGADLGHILTRARRFDESVAQLDRVLALDPNFWVTYWYLGMAYQGKGQYAEAVSAYRKGMALNRSEWLKALLINSLVKTGERQEAVKLLNELQAESESRYVSGSALAIAYGSLGEKDKAFAYLNKDVDERASRPAVFSVNPVWDDLREDPRFAEVLRRVEAGKMD